ncbi:hypothetical protein Patl1_12629 [Pistacia atlantica]|uniref:Uncharacterized protein n=1 Tax=Pistacia atlantica TaxID=434234 RepID=A0ACC1ATV0_9ROSI|nr:hypothetical protein Patl1_12629 [Pistacia atlantica]
MSSQTAFREVMAGYPTADRLLLLDICYNFSDYTSIPVPDVNFFFGDVEQKTLEVVHDGAGERVSFPPRGCN